MIVSAVILALRSVAPPLAGLWDTPLAGRPLLAHAVRNCRESGVIDESIVLTDEPEVLAGGAPEGVRVVSCPEQYRGEPFNFLNIENHLLLNEFDLTQGIGLHTELTFFLPWNLPFLNGRTLERMYHAVLDDPLTARLLPMTAVDPQLFLRTGEGGYFPVWGQKGMDRQLIQQLYRPTGACLTFWSRLLRSLPKIAGLPVDKTTAFRVRGAEDIPLAERLRAYASGREGAARPEGENVA